MSRIIYNMLVKKHKNSYTQNKNECKEIIDALLGDMGIVRNGDDTVNNALSNKTLRRTSREALKCVFKDPEMGEKTLDYFRQLKNSANSEMQNQSSTDEQQSLQELGYKDLASADGDSLFKKRAEDTQNLFSSNTRPLKFKDSFNPTVVGENEAYIKTGLLVTCLGAFALIGAIAAGMVTPLITDTIATPAAKNTISSLLFTLSVNHLVFYSTALYFDNMLEKRKGASVTKIEPEKKVNTNSKNTNNEYKNIIQSYQDLRLPYKDLIFKEITGNISLNYKKSANEMGYQVARVVHFFDTKIKGKIDPKVTGKVIIPENTNNSQTPNSLEMNILPFIIGEKPQDSFAQKAEEYKSTTQSVSLSM